MKKIYLWFLLILLAMLILAGCSSRARVGALRSEAQSIELGDASPVHVDISFGAGDLKATGGAEKMLEADFTYNVAALKPEVKFSNGSLVVRQPETRGIPNFQGITQYRNEWDLRLNNNVPMDLRVDVGAGTSDLKLGGLSLTGLDVSLGAGKYTIDLSGSLARDLDATIDTGAADLSLLLPSDVGVRVEIEGPSLVNAYGLKQDGNVYTNDAYGVSSVTMQIAMDAGIGVINLDVVEPAQAEAAWKNLLVQQAKP